MAYFANGSEGMVFDAECDSCKYGSCPCPIAMIQLTYNYEAVGNRTATKILNDLITNEGICKIKKFLKA